MAEVDGDTVWVWCRRPAAVFAVGVQLVGAAVLVVIGVVLAGHESGGIGPMLVAFAFAGLAVGVTMRAVALSTVRIDARGVRRGMPGAAVIPHHRIAGFDLDARMITMCARLHDGPPTPMYQLCRLGFSRVGSHAARPTIAATMSAHADAYSDLLSACESFTGEYKHDDEHAVLRPTS